MTAARRPDLHGLIGELGVGTVTHSALQLGLAMFCLLAGLGFTFMLAGLGLVWVGKTKTSPTATPVAERARELAAV